MQRSYMQLTSIRELVRLAQVVEQWTGNPEVFKVLRIIKL